MAVNSDVLPYSLDDSEWAAEEASLGSSFSRIRVYKCQGRGPRTFWKAKCRSAAPALVETAALRL